jgi:hypothetical protein
MGAIFDSPIQIPRRIGRAALDLLFPPLCIICRETVREPGSLCPDCWRPISFLDGPCCEACGLPFELDPGGETRCAACIMRPPAFDRARSVMRYDEHSRDPILALKHADRHDVAPAFARWLARTGADLISAADAIVPGATASPAALEQALQPVGAAGAGTGQGDGQTVRSTVRHPHPPDSQPGRNAVSQSPAAQRPWRFQTRFRARR